MDVKRTAVVRLGLTRAQRRPFLLSVLGFNVVVATARAAEHG